MVSRTWHTARDVPTKASQHTSLYLFGDLHDDAPCAFTRVQNEERGG